MDSNGDGVGDFEGLTQRLAHLEGLGISTMAVAVPAAAAEVARQVEILWFEDPVKNFIHVVNSV